MEHKFLYNTTGDVTTTTAIPFGKAAIKRPGQDVTLIATGKMVSEALSAASILARQGIDTEVIDLRSLYPFDKDCLARSVTKTHHAVIITEENKRGAYSETLSAFLNEEVFDSLDSPVQRISALDTPIPYAPVLTEQYLPNAQDILHAVMKIK
jgi:pyruvate dehydrogenase E1 component beta subunit